MQVQKIQNHNINSTTFKAVNITNPAKKLLTPKDSMMINNIRRSFENSEFVDFNLRANKGVLQSEIVLKQTGEKFLGNLRFMINNSKCYLIDKKNNYVAFRLPKCLSPQVESTVLRKFKGLDRDIFLAQMVERSGRDFNGRFLL